METNRPTRGRLGGSAWALAAALARAAAAGEDARPITPPPSPPTTAPASQPATPPEVGPLIRQLAAPRWKDRETAQNRLAELGAAAEGPLRAAMAAADSQTRLGIDRTLQQIRAARDLGPTLVSLHVKDAPPKDVFAALARQGRVPITPGRDGDWPPADGPGLTLDLADRPFWQAMRSACAAYGMRPVYDADREPGRFVVGRDPTREMEQPAAFSGSFMVVETGLTPRLVAAAEAPGTGDFELQLTFYADPKWRVLNHPDEAPIDEVLDAAGRPLPRPPAMRMAAFRPESPVWMMRTVLTRVPLADGKLRRVRGSFKITLLEQAEAVEFDNVLNARNVVKKVGRQTIQLQEVTKNGNAYQVKLTVFRSGLSPQAWRQAREADGITLLDATGRAFTRAGAEPQDDGTRASYDVTFFAGVGDQSATGVPAKVVCQVPLEPRDVTVPFELTDLTWGK